MGPNCLLFSDVYRLSGAFWDGSGVGWSPRPRAPVLGAPQRALDRNLWQIMVQSAGAQRTLLYVCTDGSAHACGVGDCPRLVPTLGGPGETSGPQINRFPSTRPPWWGRQYRELKLIFSAPSTCPIDLFGPVANGTILKQLQAAFHISKPDIIPQIQKCGPGGIYTGLKDCHRMSAGPAGVDSR